MAATLAGRTAAQAHGQTVHLAQELGALAEA